MNILSTRCTITQKLLFRWILLAAWFQRTMHESPHDTEGWHRLWDEGSQHYYWYNEHTQESQWEEEQNRNQDTSPNWDSLGDGGGGEEDVDAAVLTSDEKEEEEEEEPVSNDQEDKGGNHRREGQADVLNQPVVSSSSSWAPRTTHGSDSTTPGYGVNTLVGGNPTAVKKGMASSSSAAAATTTHASDDDDDDGGDPEEGIRHPSKGFLAAQRIQKRASSNTNPHIGQRERNRRDIVLGETQGTMRW